MNFLQLLLGPLAGIIGKVIDNKEQAAQVVGQIQVAAANGALTEEIKQLEAITSAQSDINKVEAASTNWWVAGARPGIMWVCFAALACQYVIRPSIEWVFVLKGMAAPVLPGLDDNLWQLMFGMLGMGTLRTYEKKTGVADKH